MSTIDIQKKYNNPVLIAPGFGNSGPNHWQTLWQKENPEFVRIEQKEWFTPVAEDWIDSFEKKVAQIGNECIIVAHSLGCIALALWANQTNLKIRGALLIAPADSESPEFNLNARGFSHIPKTHLPFKSIVVSSDNDPFCQIKKAEILANHWGSQFFNIGSKGHINSDSNLGHWEEGRIFLNKILQTSEL